MKTRTKIILGVGALAAVGLVATWIAARNRQRGVEVEVGKVARKEIVSTVLANGKIQPLKKVDISANIPGQVVNLAVREGEEVEKGAFLLQIDQAQYQASTRSSEARACSTRCCAALNAAWAASNDERARCASASGISCSSRDFRALSRS